MRFGLNFRTKLFVCCAALAALPLAMAFWARSTISDLGQAVAVSTASTSKKLELAGSLRTGFQQMRVRAQGAQFSLIMGMLEPADATTSVHSSGAPCAACHSPARMSEIQQTFHESGKGLRAVCSNLRKLDLGQDETAQIDFIERGIESWETKYDSYLQMARDQQFGKAHDVVADEILPAVERMEKAAATFERFERNQLDQTAAEALRQVEQSRQVSLGLVVVAFVVGCLVSVIVFRGSDVLRDLSVNLGRQAESLVVAADRIAMSSQVLAAGAAEQAGSLEQTAQATREVKDAAVGNATSSGAVAVRVAGSERLSAEATQALSGMVQAMVEIDESSGKISRIIKIIDEIAFQTNILALNAAVEAARAGQSGAGFAVVADEVRNLAQRCAAAARDTAGLIEESIARTAQGRAKLGGVEQAIRLIAEESRQIKGLMDTVSESSRKQAQETGHIREAMVEIEKVTRQAEKSASDSAGAAGELTAYSKQLEGVVGRLTEMVGGRGRVGR